MKTAAIFIAVTSLGIQAAILILLMKSDPQADAYNVGFNAGIEIGRQTLTQDVVNEVKNNGSLTLVINESRVTLVPEITE